MKHILISLIVCAAASAPVARAATLYGGNGFNFGNPNGGNLIIIDQNSGFGTFVGDPVTPGGLSGLAFAPDGTLYGSTISFGTSSLISIDPATGALSSTIGAIGIAIGDLAVNPLNGVIYGIGANAGGPGGGRLYTLDSLTGAPTLVGDTGTGNGGGIAFTPEGDLYKTSGGTLERLSLADASVVSSVFTSIYFDGFGIRPEDGAFFVTPGGGNDTILKLDPLTGLVTYVGQTGTGGVSDLAFQTSAAVPEGGFTLPLTGLAALGLAAFGTVFKPSGSRRRSGRA